MKKLIFLLPILLFSCKKEASITETTPQDSVETVESVAAKVDSASIRDSLINNSPTVKKVLKDGVMRDPEGDQIVREADASQLPFEIGDEFTKENQELVIKIKNFNQPTISASVTPKNKDMNIRINQIKYPNGDFDGPFGRSINGQKITGKGEVWLIIGKSNMASGEVKGDFTVSLD